MLVVSYTTVSPLLVIANKRFIFCGTDPADRSGWALPTTLLFGVRTFLGATQNELGNNAMIRATHLLKPEYAKTSANGISFSSFPLLLPRNTHPLRRGGMSPLRTE
jgi:hypothetical protein